jgi:hypothetical protein
VETLQLVQIFLEHTKETTPMNTTEIHVIDIMEEEDGSATLVVELSEEAKSALLSIGLKTVIEKTFGLNDQK